MKTTRWKEAGSITRCTPVKNSVNNEEGGYRPA